MLVLIGYLVFGFAMGSLTQRQIDLNEQKKECALLHHDTEEVSVQKSHVEKK